MSSTSTLPLAPFGQRAGETQHHLPVRVASRPRAACPGRWRRTRPPGTLPVDVGAVVPRWPESARRLRRRPRSCPTPRRGRWQASRPCAAHPLASGPETSQTTSSTGATRTAPNPSARPPGCDAQAGADAQPGGDQHRDDARGGERRARARTSCRSRYRGRAAPRPASTRTRASARVARCVKPMRWRSRLVTTEREEEVERDRAEAEPERPVRGDERDHHVDPADRRERVGDDRDHVDGEEHEHQQRHVAVHELDDEARPRGAAPAERRQDPEQHARGEKPEGDDTRRARDVPRHRATGEREDRVHERADAATNRPSACGAAAGT